MHFTRVEHLNTIAVHGLLADNLAGAQGVLAIEVGNTGIKMDRRLRAVPAAPGGVVADYVPFYFAPRSPMMFAIDGGRVPEYQDGSERLIYLVTTAQAVMGASRPVLITDRNAVLRFAEYGTGEGALDTLVDWPLMKEKYWSNTVEDPDRRERRMAECLVHQVVPWSLFQAVVTKTEAVAAEARAMLSNLGSETPVVVRPSWYF